MSDEHDEPPVARGKGRPTLLDADVAERFTAMLRAGSRVLVACDAVGIHRATYARWMTRGLSRRKRDAPYRDFRAGVEQALGEAEARAVMQVARAGNDDWRAAAWLLEHGFAERWGKQAERVRLVVPEDEVPEQTKEQDPFAELDELASRRRRGPPG